jgi:sterol 14alpha-demethylase
MLMTGRCLLRKEVREKMLDDFFTLYHEMADNGTSLFTLLYPYAPTLANYRRDRARTKIAEMLAKIMRSRKRSNRVEEDVLQNLIDSKYKDGHPTTESEITGMMIALIMAAKQSCSATVTWTGVRLLHHPKWLAVAIKEQKEIISKKGNFIDYSTLLEMDNLHCCIKETLRMHPPAPALLRKVHNDFIVQTSEGNVYEIPRGHNLVSPILFSSNIPYIYKDPEVYDPERFGPSREEDKSGGKLSYLSFGGGRHMLAWVRLILIHKLRWYGAIC